MNAKTKLFVIIVTYNGAEWIEKCLNSVYNSSIEAIPIVIDNGSEDNTLSLIRNGFPMCQILETGSNLGFGKANNLGIQKAIEQGAEYIYLLNQDAWVFYDTFEILISAHKSSSDKYGIISPLQLNGMGTDYDKNFKQNTLYPLLEKYGKEMFDMKELYNVEKVAAAHWLMYVPYILKVGHFSPIFPHYGEDNNLVHRFQYHGYKVGIDTKAKACHDRQYRVDTSQKKLYLQVIQYLIWLNNPNKSGVKYHISSFLHFVSRSIKIKGVHFPEKISAILKGIKYISNSKKYRKIYIGTNCYKAFFVSADKSL